ncbi:hypothetical protein JOD49_003863 [Oerskovia jenensis]|uniref:Uncharacterized protein n=1 Tax=Oerskovia jenensis TaxID=162169 RepID=A0ABS2LKI7_9CELL|nr:hypothetical protein [Oerskovia jenensis]
MARPRPRPTNPCEPIPAPSVGTRHRATPPPPPRNLTGQTTPPEPLVPGCGQPPPPAPAPAPRSRTTPGTRAPGTSRTCGYRRPTMRLTSLSGRNPTPTACSAPRPSNPRPGTTTTFPAFDHDLEAANRPETASTPFSTPASPQGGLCRRATEAPPPDSRGQGLGPRKVDVRRRAAPGCGSTPRNARPARAPWP